MPFTNPQWPFRNTASPRVLARWGGIEELYSWRLDGERADVIRQWHPALREEERLTFNSFFREDLPSRDGHYYPAQLLFQDQLGAIGLDDYWYAYEANPEGTSYLAYHPGILENTRYWWQEYGVPLFTEDGWDHLIHYITGFCGMSHFIAWAFEQAPDLFGQWFGHGNWRHFPMANILSRTHVAFYYHNLGQFISTPENLAPAMALGINLSVSGAYQDDYPEWLEVAYVLQSRVLSRIFGVDMIGFAYLDDSLTRSVFANGQVHLVNHSDREMNIGDTRQEVVLAPYGFWAVDGDELQAGLISAKDGLAYAKPTFYVSEVVGDEVRLWIKPMLWKDWRYAGIEDKLQGVTSAPRLESWHDPEEIATTAVLMDGTRVPVSCVVSEGLVYFPVYSSFGGLKVAEYVVAYGTGARSKRGLAEQQVSLEAEVTYRYGRFILKGTSTPHSHIYCIGYTKSGGAIRLETKADAEGTFLINLTYLPAPEGSLLVVAWDPEERHVPRSMTVAVLFE